MARAARAIACALCALLPAACVSLEDRIVAPRASPLLAPRLVRWIERDLGLQARYWRPDTGPALRHRVLEPAEYGLDYRYRGDADGATFAFSLRAPEGGRRRLPADGTVVLLHGWGLDGDSLLPWALAFAERGWRAIIVDLRNHGGSGRAPPGFGPAEGAEVAALVQALRADGTATGPLHLFGVSYGAVSAIHAAAALGEDVRSVVAIAPYANAEDGVRDMIAAALRSRGGSPAERLFLAQARRRYDADAIDAAIARAERRLGFDLAGIEVAAPLRASRGCTLILHGSDDGFFAPASIRALAGASPRAQYVELAGERHATAPMRLDWLATPVDAWWRRLDGAAAASPPATCAAFALPPAPAAD